MNVRERARAARERLTHASASCARAWRLGGGLVDAWWPVRAHSPDLRRADVQMRIIRIVIPYRADGRESAAQSGPSVAPTCRLWMHYLPTCQLNHGVRPECAVRCAIRPLSAPCQAARLRHPAPVRPRIRLRMPSGAAGAASGAAIRCQVSVAVAAYLRRSTATQGGQSRPRDRNHCQAGGRAPAMIKCRGAYGGLLDPRGTGTPSQKFAKSVEPAPLSSHFGFPLTSPHVPSRPLTFPEGRA